MVPLKDVIVIGGGISGLTAARRLAAAGRTVQVLEAGPTVGGRMRSIRHDEDLVDVGAAFFTDFYPETRRILRELGMDDHLEDFSLHAGVLRDGGVRPIFPPLAFLTGGPLSALSMLRLAGGLLTLLPHWFSLDPDDLFAARALDTETVTAWSNRVLGRECTEHLLTPVLRGVIHWEADTTSRAVLFTMLKAAVKYHRAYRLSPSMQSLCDVMAAPLDVSTSAHVRRAVWDGERWVVDYEQAGVDAGRPGTAEQLQARAVVCTIPASRVPGVFPALDGPERRFFEEIQYSSTAICVLRLPAADARRIGSVFLDSTDGSTLDGVTSFVAGPSSRHGFVRLSLSTPAYRTHAEEADEKLATFAHEAAARLPAVGHLLEQGEVVTVVRWPEALPLFDVGHLERAHAWRKRARQFPTLAFAGDYLRGPYVEGAVKSGLDAAAQLNGPALTRAFPSMPPAG
jgi:oxygen-dependent protoporphyrinogen oxidase